MSFRIVPLVKGTAPPIALYRPVLLIGRHPECDVRIDSPKVSRRHCCIATAYDRVLIRDLGSRNGVRVNGRLLEESTTRAGRRAGNRAHLVSPGGGGRATRRAGPAGRGAGRRVRPRFARRPRVQGLERRRASTGLGCRSRAARRHLKISSSGLTRRSTMIRRFGSIGAAE